MSDPRWRDSDPRPMYRGEQRPAARRQPLPRERDQRGHGPRDRDPGGRDSRGLDARRPRGRDRRTPDWQEPGPWDAGPGEGDGRPLARDGRRPAQGDGRLHWGALPGVLGVCIVVGGAALGALVSAVTSSQPGLMLSAFVVVSTVCAVLAVRPASVYRIIPVPALAYLVASVMTGLAVNQNGTTLTALAVGAAQWIASGFVAMLIATVIAIVATIVRRPRAKGGPPRSPNPGPGRGPGGSSRSPRAASGRPGRPQDDRPRWPQEPRIRRTQDRDADSLSTAAFPDWHREARNG